MDTHTQRERERHTQRERERERERHTHTHTHTSCMRALLVKVFDYIILSLVLLMSNGLIIKTKDTF